MELDTVSQKHINKLEQMTNQLLQTMRIAKLQHLQVYTALQDLERYLSAERRSRFDEKDSRYEGY